MYKTEIDKIRLSLASKTQFWSLKQVTWYYYFVFLINLYWSIAALLLERKQKPTPVFLSGKFHGQRILGGYSPLGCKKLDMTEQLTFFSFFFTTVCQFILYSKVNQLYVHIYPLFSGSPFQCNITQKELNLVICRDVAGPRDCHTE